MKLHTLPLLTTLLLLSAGCSHIERSAEERVPTAPTTRGDYLEVVEAPAPSPRLIDLAIAGTHDSAANTGGPAAQCQDLSIADQLSIGVRAYDLRLVDRYDGSGRLDLYHGPFNLRQELTTNLLPLFADFLESHPEEFLILSFRKEDDSKGEAKYRRSYEESLTRALSEERISKLLYRGELTPETTLDEVKGRLVILNRTTIEGPDWSHNFAGFRDNRVFTCRMTSPEGSELETVVQDQYKVRDILHMEDKKLSIQELLELAGDRPDAWSICFLSGSAPTIPSAVARVINPFALLTLSLEEQIPGGIYFMDFAGMPEARGIIKLMERQNSKQ